MTAMAPADVHALRVCLGPAADWLASADGLLVTAGAGMGVDSGLPDFRGTEGFWRAYPPLAAARIRFEEIANPVHFSRDPALAWGFYGHRLALYRETVPHDGFAILRRFGAHLPDGAFVFTSNVDGQFQKAGFDPARVCEVHGSIHHLQCREPCCEAIWPADAFHPEVDAASCRLGNEAPVCPFCGSMARPNILMFGDFSWVEARTRQQQAALDAWRQGIRRLVVIEIGAGLAVPTVRWYGESLGVPLLRINTTQPEVASARAIGVASGAAETLTVLAALMRDRGWVAQDEDR
jgi:NAD-dependent SIR2 family protein deacetylase